MAVSLQKTFQKQPSRASLELQEQPSARFCHIAAYFITKVFSFSDAVILMNKVEHKLKEKSLKTFRSMKGERIRNFRAIESGPLIQEIRQVTNSILQESCKAEKSLSEIFAGFSDFSKNVRKPSQLSRIEIIQGIGQELGKGVLKTMDFLKKMKEQMGNKDQISFEKVINYRKGGFSNESIFLHMFRVIELINKRLEKSESKEKISLPDKKESKV